MISKHASCFFSTQSDTEASLWVQLVRDFTLDDGTMSDEMLNHVSGPPPSLGGLVRANSAVAAFAAAGATAAAGRESQGGGGGGGGAAGSSADAATAAADPSASGGKRSKSFGVWGSRLREGCCAQVAREKV